MNRIRIFNSLNTEASELPKGRLLLYFGENVCDYLEISVCPHDDARIEIRSGDATLDIRPVVSNKISVGVVKELQR